MTTDQKPLLQRPRLADQSSTQRPQTTKSLTEASHGHGGAQGGLVVHDQTAQRVQRPGSLGSCCNLAHGGA